MSSGKRRKLCCGKILAEIETWIVFIFALKNWHLSRSEDIERTNVILLRGRSPIPETGCRSELKVCGPEAEPSQSEAPPVAARHSAMQDAASGEESANWTTDGHWENTSPGALRPPEPRAARTLETEGKRAHWIAHTELLGGLTVLDTGSWL